MSQGSGRTTQWLHRTAFVGAVGVVLGVAFPSRVMAQERLEAAYHAFGDSEGNRIDSWVLDYLQACGEAWSFDLRGALDRVHLPPLPGLPGSRENVDAITAASRPVQSAADSKQEFVKQRQELVASLLWAARGRPLRATGSYYVSRESDFLGQQAAVEMARDWAGGSTNLAIRAAYGFDRITPDVHTGGDPTPRDRTSLDLTATCTQSLTSKTQIQLGLEVTAVQGFQANPYRHVYAGGQVLPERHPEERLRRAAFAEIDRYLGTRSSVSLAVRWYGDDWGVGAGTFDARFNQYVGERLIVRYRYRYHAQNAARFHRDFYALATGVDGYRTADYKLQGFDSNLFGVKASIPFEGTAPWLDGVLLDLKYERYFDSQSFAANVFETGLSWPF